jgi:hypothetical protein
MTDSLTARPRNSKWARSTPGGEPAGQVGDEEALSGSVASLSRPGCLPALRCFLPSPLSSLLSHRMRGSVADNSRGSRIFPLFVLLLTCGRTGALA